MTGQSKKSQDFDAISASISGSAAGDIVAALGAADVPALVIDPKSGRIIKCTQAMAALIGVDDSAIEGKAADDLLWRPDDSLTAAPGCAALRRRDGRLVWAAFNWIAQSDGSLVGVVTDVTSLVAEAAVSLVCAAVATAAVSAGGVEEFAAACVEALREAGLVESAVFIRPWPEAQRWRIVAARAPDTSLAPSGPESLVSAADIGLRGGERLCGTTPIGPTEAGPAVRRVLGETSASGVWLPICWHSKLAAVIFASPPQPLLSLSNQTGRVCAAIAQGLASIVQRLSVEARQTSGLPAARAQWSNQAIERLSLVAAGLGAARSAEEALSVAFDALRSELGAEWAALVKRQTGARAFTVLAASTSMPSAPVDVGHVIGHSEPAVAAVSAPDGERVACGDIAEPLTPLEKALANANLRHWAAAAADPDIEPDTLLVVARTTQSGGPLAREELALLRAVAAMVALVDIHGPRDQHGLSLLTSDRRLSNWLVESERLQVAMQVARGVTHFLGNQLSILVGRLEMAVRRAGDEVTRSALEEGLQAAEAAGDCLRQLQVIAWRPAEDVSSTMPAAEPVRRAADIVIDQKRRWLGNRAEAFVIDIDCSSDAVILGNREQLVAALVAIFQNAFEATPNGGTVKVKIDALERWARILVTDHGGGIPHHLTERVFDPFFSTKGPSRAGLGLTVASTVVTKHGGRVLIGSALRQGTTVAVYLPRADQPPREAGGGAE